MISLLIPQCTCLCSLMYVFVLCVFRRSQERSRTKEKGESAGDQTSSSPPGNKTTTRRESLTCCQRETHAVTLLWSEAQSWYEQSTELHVCWQLQAACCRTMLILVHLNWVFLFVFLSSAWSLWEGLQLIHRHAEQQAEWWVTTDNNSSVVPF